MDFITANSMFGNKLDGHHVVEDGDGKSNENFVRMNIDETKIEDNNSNSSNFSSSIITTIIEKQQDFDYLLHNDDNSNNNQIQNLQQEEEILLNSITSEYQRRKEILEDKGQKQKTALATTAQERKTKLKQAYNAAYKAMNNAKIQAYKQLTSDQNIKDVADDEEEQAKISKKREAYHKNYLRQKERLAEKKASMTKEQLLALHEKQHQANKQKEERRKAKLRAYEDLVREGKAEKIGIGDFGFTESKQAPTGDSLGDEQKSAHLVQKLERNAQRKREAWAKARVTQTAAKNKAET